METPILIGDSCQVWLRVHCHQILPCEHRKTTCVANLCSWYQDVPSEYSYFPEEFNNQINGPFSKGFLLPIVSNTMAFGSCHGKTVDTKFSPIVWCLGAMYLGIPWIINVQKKIIKSMDWFKGKSTGNHRFSQ
jgi:hypothetical protein